MEHEGRAVVFPSLEDQAARIDPDLDLAADDILVLQNAGPKSPLGMPEAGYVPIPKTLVQAGVKDMVRISDAHMSGTAFGTIVLHVLPEAAIGGSLSQVRNDARIRLFASEKRIDLLVDAATLERRAAETTCQVYRPERGYARRNSDHVTSATQGAISTFCEASHPSFGKGDRSVIWNAGSAVALSDPRCGLVIVPEHGRKLMQIIA